MRATLVAILVAVAGLLVQASITRPGPIAADQLAYLSIASDLAETGRFTNGNDDASLAPADRPPGMMVTPLYPAFIAAVLMVDPKLAATARCLSTWHTGSGVDCPSGQSGLGILVPLQFGLAVVTLLLLWRTAATIARSERVAWIALVVAAFGCYEYAIFARLALTENLAAPLLCAFSLHLCLTVRDRRWGYALAAGIELGLASLTRPQFIYLAYVGAFLVVAGSALALATGRWPAYRRLAAQTGIVCLCCAAIVLPWMLRDAVVLGNFELTQGYGPAALAHRVAYNDMRLDEFVAGWIYFLPDFGHSWARALFPATSYHRLGLDEAPDTFYMIGGHVLLPQVAAAAGSAANQLSYLLHHYVLAHPLKHAAVTLLMAWRGLWVGKYFSVVCVPLLAGALVSGAFRRSNDLLMLSLPGLFLLFFQAAVSVSMPRYNIFLIPSMSLAAAMRFHAIGVSLKPLLWRRAGVVAR